MSCVSARCKPTVHDRADATSMSGMKRVDVVRAIRPNRNRERRRLGKRRRVEAVRFAQQHRPAFAGTDQSGAHIARQAQRAAGVGSIDAGEAANALPFERFRVAAANRRLFGIAEERAQPAALDVRPPRDADVRREVVPVGVVAAGAAS